MNNSPSNIFLTLLLLSPKLSGGFGGYRREWVNIPQGEMKKIMN